MYKESGNQEWKKAMETQFNKDNFKINFHFNFWKLLVENIHFKQYKLF